MRLQRTSTTTGPESPVPSCSRSQAAETIGRGAEFTPESLPARTSGPPCSRPAWWGTRRSRVRFGVRIPATWDCRQDHVSGMGAIACGWMPPARAADAPDLPIQFELIQLRRDFDALPGCPAHGRPRQCRTLRGTRRCPACFLVAGRTRAHPAGLMTCRASFPMSRIPGASVPQSQTNTTPKPPLFVAPAPDSRDIRHEHTFYKVEANLGIVGSLVYRASIDTLRRSSTAGCHRGAGAP